MSKFIISAALLSVAALTSPGQAETYQVGSANVRTVSVRDLDLTNPKDVALLDRRINSAVKQVCPPLDGMDLMKMRLARKCRSDTLARTQTKRDAVIAAAQASQSTQVASITVR